MNNLTHAVGIIFEEEGGKILLLKRHKDDPEGETWGLVGGKVDPGEKEIESAIREVKEEIGYQVDKENLLFLQTYEWFREDINLIFDTFKSQVKNSDVNLDLDKKENTEFMWISPVDAFRRDDLMKGLYSILEDNYSVK